MPADPPEEPVGGSAPADLDPGRPQPVGDRAGRLALAEHVTRQSSAARNRGSSTASYQYFSEPPQYGGSPWTAMVE